MVERTRRKNPELFGWLRAVAIAGLTWSGMAVIQARPLWFVAALALSAGVVSLANAEIGVLIALAGLCLPLIAAHPVVGLAVVVLAFFTEHALGGRGATGFLLIGLAVLGAFFGPVWASAVLAGCLLGPGEGALTAAASVLVVEAMGVLAGRGAIGLIVTGGRLPAIVSFTHAPATLLSTAWISAGLKSLSGRTVSQLFSSLGHVGHGPALLAQAGVWALGAIVAGTIVTRSGPRPKLTALVAGAGVGIASIAGGDWLMRLAFGLPSAAVASGVALVASLAVALGFLGVRETLFATEVETVAVPGPHPATMAAEDADVDELLRLIATAEDKLASKHTSQRVVLITDMKAFSRMTEEDGSVASAKTIQRHRDLLVPIISRNGGCGKSTGGDGIVAAFESASDAIGAAVEGQRALAEYNASHANERVIMVRMGLASGEVVLDKGARPFIGAGLNLAARVMTLADGGQIFATGDVITAAASKGGPATHTFGEFALKNIANPIEISEVLWGVGQQPRDPRAEKTAS